MVEVFRTNVSHREEADMLLRDIHNTLYLCKANFDLDDIDHILRVEFASPFFQPASVIDLLRKHGFAAEILEDEVPYAKAEA